MGDAAGRPAAPALDDWTPRKLSPSLAPLSCPDAPLRAVARGLPMRGNLGARFRQIRAPGSIRLGPTRALAACSRGAARPVHREWGFGPARGPVTAGDSAHFPALRPPGNRSGPLGIRSRLWRAVAHGQHARPNRPPLLARPSTATGIRTLPRSGNGGPIRPFCGGSTAGEPPSTVRNPVPTVAQLWRTLCNETQRSQRVQRRNAAKRLRVGHDGRATRTERPRRSSRRRAGPIPPTDVVDGSLGRGCQRPD